MSKVATINFQDFAGGALAEQINCELQKVLENIADPNTDAEKSRKLTITMTFKPDETREDVKVSFVSRATLVPIKSIATRIIVDRDKSGQIVAAEWTKQIRGQVSLDEAEANKDYDTSANNENVVDLRRAKDAK